MHSSDHPCLVPVAELLDGTNFGVWIVVMTTILEAKNKMGFLDGSIVKPDENYSYSKIWSRCNSIVKSWLLNSVSKKFIRVFSTSRMLLIYGRIFILIFTSPICQGSLDLSSNHTQTRSLWEELANILVTPRTVEDLLVERETNRVIDFLMDLMTTIKVL